MKYLISIIVTAILFHASAVSARDWYVIGGLGAHDIRDNAQISGTHPPYTEMEVERDENFLVGVGWKFDDYMHAELLYHDFGTVSAMKFEREFDCVPQPVGPPKCDLISETSFAVEDHLNPISLSGVVNMRAPDKKWLPYFRAGLTFDNRVGAMMGLGIKRGPLAVEYMYLPSVETWSSVDIHTVDLILRF